MEVFSQLGIDWKLLLAQMVNIIILIGVLYWALHKPVLKLLDSRRDMVAATVQKSQEIEQRLAQVTIQQEALLNEARVQAQDLIASARQAAALQQEKGIATAKNDIAQLVTSAKVQINQERQTMMEQARRDLAGLITQATTSVVGDLVREPVDRALVQKAIDQIANTRL